MGQSKGFRSFIQRYVRVRHLHKRNTRILGADHLMVDLNNYLYYTGQGKKPHQVLAKVRRLIAHQRRLCSPRRTLFLAMDGSAPLSKLLLQQERRHADGGDRAERALKLTPGSEFMRRLEWGAQRIAASFIEPHHPLQVYLSGPSQPGEGEWKLAHFLSARAQQQGWGGKKGVPAVMERCVLLSDDSDMILYGLALTDRYHVTLMVDRVDLMDISKLRGALVAEVLGSRLPQATEEERRQVIDDFLFLSTLQGSDFFPGLPFFEMEGAWQRYVAARQRPEYHQQGLFFRALDTTRWNATAGEGAEDTTTLWTDLQSGARPPLLHEDLFREVVLDPCLHAYQQGTRNTKEAQEPTLSQVWDYYASHNKQTSIVIEELRADNTTPTPDPTMTWEQYLPLEFQASGGNEWGDKLTLWGSTPIEQAPIPPPNQAMPPDSFYENEGQRCLLGLRLNGALVATGMGRTTKLARRVLMTNELPRIMALYKQYTSENNKEHVTYEEFYRRKRAAELHPKSEAEQEEQLRSYLENLQWYVHYLYGEKAPSKAYLYSAAPSLPFLSRHLSEAIIPVQMNLPPVPPLHPIEVFLLLSPAAEIMKNISHSYRHYTAAHLRELKDLKKDPLRTTFHSSVDRVRAIVASFAPSASAPAGEKEATSDAVGAVLVEKVKEVSGIAEKASAMVQRFKEREERLAGVDVPRGEKSATVTTVGPDPALLFPNLLFTNRLNMILPHWDRPEEPRTQRALDEEEQRHVEQEDKAFRVNNTPHLCLQSDSLHPASFTQIYQPSDALDHTPPVQWDNF